MRKTFYISTYSFLMGITLVLPLFLVAAGCVIVALVWREALWNGTLETYLLSALGLAFVITGLNDILVAASFYIALLRNRGKQWLSVYPKWSGADRLIIRPRIFC